MSGNAGQLIFSELLARHGRIRIPLIQRDFAQGRADQHEVRDEFLSALHQALKLPSDSPVLPINLDFIYGSVEGDAPSCFQPLDGQQRLTTLFLLHWYLAWKDNCIDSFRELCAHGNVSRFSYHVRPSSSEFFDALVVFTPSCSPEEVEKISSLLTNQPWYFRSWRLDPTIQSTLMMLDAIHARFGPESGLYSRLTDSQKPSITFQLLDLKDFGLSDDLYIKMNVRGKPLTQFETFKARYEQKLKELFPSTTRVLDGQSIPISEFFSRRMDTRWADFFWPYRDSATHVFDSAVMNVFRVIILITRSPQRENFVDDVTKLRNQFAKNSYAFFHDDNWLDAAFSENLITLLEAWSKDDSRFAKQLPDRRYFNETAVFRKILSDPTKLGYEEVLQFAAYAQFLYSHSENFDPVVFQEWMRIVFNLVVNTEYNRPADMQRSLSTIIQLEPKMTTILEYLAKPETEIGGFNKQQIEEEQLKARLITADNKWRTLIDDAESHAYFRGQIGFLLRFCGAGTHPAAYGNTAWTASELQELMGCFNRYLQIAAAMFDHSGLRNLNNFEWERALLTIGDYLLPVRRNHSFLVNSQADQASWKRFLRIAATDSQKGNVLRSLWDRLSGTTDLAAQLDAVIANASTADDWRAAIIATPSAIRYCQHRMIRRAEDNSIYLLKKSQMNGAHAHLSTYTLCQNFLIPAQKRGDLRTLIPWYLDSNSADEEPCIRFQVPLDNMTLTFSIEFKESHYQIYLRQPESPPSSLSALLVELDFTQTIHYLRKSCSNTEIQEAIQLLDLRLSEWRLKHA